MGDESEGRRDVRFTLCGRLEVHGMEQAAQRFGKVMSKLGIQNAYASDGSKHQAWSLGRNCMWVTKLPRGSDRIQPNLEWLDRAHEEMMMRDNQNPKMMSECKVKMDGIVSTQNSVRNDIEKIKQRVRCCDKLIAFTDESFT